MKVQRLRCIKFLKSLLLMIARNEMPTWGAKQVSDIFKDSETFYIFPNCLDSFIICAMFFGFAVCIYLVRKWKLCH